MNKLKVNRSVLAAQRYRQAVARDAPFLELVQLRLAYERAWSDELDEVLLSLKKGLA